MPNKEIQMERAGKSDENRRGSDRPGGEPGAAQAAESEPQGRLETVIGPEPFAPIFMRAQQRVASYFADRIEDPVVGSMLSRQRQRRQNL